MLGRPSHLKVFQTQDLNATLLAACDQSAVKCLHEHNRPHRLAFLANTVQNHASLFGHIADHG